MKFRNFAPLALSAALAACATSKKDMAPVNPGTQAAMVKADLKPLAEFKEAQVTGVTMSESGRLFANFPRWREGLPFSVVEVMKDGTYAAYPNEDWNAWKGSGQPAKNQFNTVQSVVAHGNSLYVLDPSSPLMKGVVGKPKLYEFDLATNTLKKTYEFTEFVAPKASYLNDLRVDDANQAIYITDSGLGAIVVVDMKTNKIRRLLGQDPSVKSEGMKITAEGRELSVGGKPPQINSDGIALSPDGKYLFYHALTASTLYRVPTAALNDKKLSAKKLSAAVEKQGLTPAPDGMIFDAQGNLYRADLQSNSVVYRTPSGEIKTLAQDPRIKWADTFTLTPAKDQLIFTASRLHETPAGTPADGYTYSIYQIKTATK